MWNLMIGWIKNSSRDCTGRQKHFWLETTACSAQSRSNFDTTLFITKWPVMSEPLPGERARPTASTWPQISSGVSRKTGGPTTAMTTFSRVWLRPWVARGYADLQGGRNRIRSSNRDHDNSSAARQGERSEGKQSALGAAWRTRQPGYRAVQPLRASFCAVG